MFAQTSKKLFVCHLLWLTIGALLLSPSYAQSKKKTSERWRHAQSVLERHAAESEKKQETKQATNEAKVIEYAPEDVSLDPQNITRYSPDRNTFLGFVVWENTDYKIAVGYLESKFLNVEERVVTRDRDLKITSVLSSAKRRNGRSYGFEVITGRPNIGDEIILPGPNLKAALPEE